MIGKNSGKLRQPITAAEWFDLDRSEKAMTNRRKFVFSPSQKIYQGNPGDICPVCGHDVSSDVVFGDSGEPDFESGGTCPDCGNFSTMEQWENTDE